LADIWINILGDATKLKSALSGAGKNMTAFGEKIGKIGRTMTIVGGAVTAAFGAIVMKTTQVGDQFDKMSLRTGIAVEDLSALAYAADISGSDIGTLEKGLKALTKVMDDASRGIGEGLDAFRELDIAVVDVDGNLRSTVDILKEAATKISEIEDPTKQAAYAMDLFGSRAGPQLLPLLKMGEAGIEELMKKAEELGITMTTEAATAAAEFTDRMTDLKGSVAGAGRSIGMILIPPLTNLAEKAIEMVKKIKTWTDAHKPLVEIIIKVGATLGVLAAVGGPILMAVSAFIKMKAAIALIGTVASGPIGIIIMAVGALALAWTTNFGGIRDFTDKVIEHLKGPFNWLKDRLNSIKEGLVTFGKWIGVIPEGIKATEGAVEAFGKKIDSVADQIEKKLGGTIEELKKMADLEVILKPAEEAIKKIIDSMTPYENKLQAINDRYDEAIEKIKTYITEEEELKATTDRLNEGRKAEITLLDREKTALEKVAEAKRKLADLTKSLTDKIYEFTHTEYEISLRDINREYDLLVENAKEVYKSEKELAEAIKIFNEERQKEIDALKESNKLKEEATEDNKDLKDSYEDLEKGIEGVTEATEEAGKAAKNAGILGGQGWEEFTTQIKRATTALSNFTKEGVAAAIASIKMKFFPVLQDLYKSLETAGRYSFLIHAQIGEVLKMQAEQIATIVHGYKEYLEILQSMGGGIEGRISLPSYQTGIRYVPQTGLAVVHRGEEINPPGQRSYDKRKYSNVVNIYNPIVRNDDDINKIERLIQNILDKDSQERLRSGNELMLGA